MLNKYPFDQILREVNFKVAEKRRQLIGIGGKNLQEGIVVDDVFYKHVDALGAALLDVAREYVAENGLGRLDERAFKDQSHVQVGELSQLLLCLGADQWPESSVEIKDKLPVAA